MVANKATQKVKAYYELIALHNPNSEEAITAFEKYFSKIWTPKSILKSNKLDSKEKVVALLVDFDNALIKDFYKEAKILGEIDQFIFMAFASVPINKWTSFLKINFPRFYKIGAKNHCG